MPTQILKCKDCGDEFTWTEGEQEFYASKGLQQPKRCQHCRQAKHERRGDRRDRRSRRES